MSCGDTFNTCVSCNCNPCQCQQTVRASPSPYYNQAGCIQETHCQSITQQVFVTALSTGADVIMPSCASTVIIPFTGLGLIQIGSYLWSATFGYLLVTAFDYLSGEVTVVNECLAGNAAPGTLIPRCSLFNVVDPPS